MRLLWGMMCCVCVGGCVCNCVLRCVFCGQIVCIVGVVVNMCMVHVVCVVNVMCIDCIVCVVYVVWVASICVM